MAEATTSAFPLLIAAALARDLEAAGLLSDASRKAIHIGLGPLRDAIGGTEGEAKASGEAAIRILEDIAPAADG
ncbi:hypothetical protein [Sphingomonas profundi]|uniref:hypothetical protein n=1 Tax=Alterirhizorhabdus profundi TaxID=2681549 RepID=UPI0012E8FC3B|nr:hypothetical protein [Sphingomonas profundi]